MPRRVGPLKLAARIGEELQARWWAVHNDHRRFPDLAVAVLEEFSPAERLTPEDLARCVFAARVLPFQEDPEAKFGDLPVTLFRGREFHIGALFWIDSTTSIHQHGFSGAFQVLAGSSVHARYRFEPTRYLDDHVQLGKLATPEVEMLESGDVRPILTGVGSLHALWHLERPSVTFIIREYGRSSALPQNAYLRPCIAYDPFFDDQTTTRRLQMLSVLRRADAPVFGEMIEAMAREGAPLPIVQVARWVSPLPAEFGQRLVHAVGEHDGEYATALDAVLVELTRERRICFARDKVQGADERLLLGLLLHLPDRAEVLRQLERLRPSADAAELVAGWICSIIHQTHAVEVSAAGRATLTSLLGADTAAEAMDGLQDLPPGDAKALRYITGRSRVFESLFT